MSAARPKLVLTPRVGSPRQSTDTKAMSAVESSGVVYAGPAVSVASLHEDGDHVILQKTLHSRPEGDHHDGRRPQEY
jgi:hypothetical protein